MPLRTLGFAGVADLRFSRAAVERTIDGATRQLYVLAGLAALVMYLAILPVLARLAKRLPLPVDPIRRAKIGGLKSALARRELVLHYQPKLAVSTAEVVGVEALVRWNHPQRGLLGPAEFLPLAESSPELLAALTCQVLERALGDCAGWMRDEMQLPVAVNVPASALVDASLASTIQDTLVAHGLEPTMLTLEVTESAMMEQVGDLLVPLTELRALGVSVSIDDFGTGHSSLARLQSLPLDEIKVDRSFVAGITVDERDRKITRLIIGLGSELGLQVVAEGVEDEETLDLLRTLGCSVAQGFYISRPLPENLLRQWLARERWGISGAAVRTPGSPLTRPLEMAPRSVA